MQFPEAFPAHDIQQRLFTCITAILTAFVIMPMQSWASTGVSDNAPSKAFYAGFGENCCGEDPHPVHGIATPDGGYAIVGKSMDTSGNQDGFILKFNADSLSGTSFVEPEQFSSIGWSKTMGSSGNMDGFNNVAATATALFASGFRYTNGVSIDRYLVKYDLSTGNKIWEAAFPDTTSSRDGAYESMSTTSDGGLVLTGVMDAESGSLEGFKSYGNPSTGQAFVEYFSPSQLNSDNAPQSSTWITNLTGANSGKGIEQLSSGGYIVAALDEEEGPGRAYRLDASGSIVWSNPYPDHGEVTDVAVLSEDGTTTGFALTGHYRPSEGGIDGSITHLGLDGEIIWHKGIGNPTGGVGQFAGLGTGNPTLIFDECWGIQGTSDGGMVVACGTGIEGCGEYSPGSPIHTECISDPRRTWRGLVVKLDKNGNEVWQRVDSFIEPGEEEAPDSASEYVSLKADGSVVSIVDQGFGIGVLVLNPSNDNTPANSSGSDDAINPDDENEKPEDHDSDDSGINEASDDSSTSGEHGDSGSPSSGCSSLPGSTNTYSVSWIVVCLLSLTWLRRKRRFV